MENEQTSVGWGRIAASRFAKTPEEIQNDIMKALEGKLLIDFPVQAPDYSQWQRVSIPTTSPQPSLNKSYKSKSTQSKSRPLTGTSGLTACSSLCLHPWNKKAPNVDLTAEIEKSKRIAVLQAQILARKKSVEQYSQLKDELNTNNATLKDHIISCESTTHKGVTKLLEKYEKYTSASKVLSKNHVVQIETAQAELNSMAGKFAKEIADLTDESQYLDAKVQVLLQDLQVLRTYKDKEYPVKAMCIAKLSNNVGNLSIDQRDEMEELKRIISGERMKMLAHRMNQTEAIVDHAAEDAFKSCTSRSLQLLSRKNQVIAYEIMQNRQEISELTLIVEQLENEVKILSNMAETNVRKYVFPELKVMDTPMCHPDEDVILDIPTQQMLPI
uniref:Uncharacterized protein n=1 Tax=Ciona savignyi TaxID=51511 RepID=H2ZPF5_CIOSA